MRAGALLLLLLLLGCKSVGVAGETAELTVDTLEVSFATASRGQLELGLTVRGGGLARQAQWQLSIDGQPLGSGVQVLGQQLDPLEPSVVALTAPLLTSHSVRDDGWRTVTLELAGELLVERGLDLRMPFAARKQVLVRGAPRFF